jgi:hypothetical protein
VTTMHMVFKGVGADQSLYWASHDGRNWSTADRPAPPVPDVGSSRGPAMTVFQGRIHLAWKGIWDDQHVY